VYVSWFLIGLPGNDREEDAMAVDLISRARERRERLLAELGRIDAFLAMANELAQEFGERPTPLRAQFTDAPRRSTKRRNLGSETVAAAIEIIRDRGHSLPTRDLVPLISARGIEIGGKSPIATLSARLSAAKGSTLDLINGKWCLINGDGMPRAGVSEQDEPADSSLTGKSADSLFNRQANGGAHAAALT
jgi:hypothetical protein